MILLMMNQLQLINQLHPLKRLPLLNQPLHQLMIHLLQQLMKQMMIIPQLVNNLQYQLE